MRQLIDTWKRLRYDRIVWVLFLLVTVGILLSSVARKKNSFADGVEVEVVPLEGGEKLISERDVEQALLAAFGNTLEGTELRSLDVERMEKVLEDDPFVRDAETYVDQHNILHLDVEQREPLVRVLDNKGGNYYLDPEGNKMPPSRNFAARVLIATGNIAPYAPTFREKKRSTLKDVFDVAHYLAKDDFYRVFFQQIHVEANGNLVLVPLVGDQKIILGDARELDDKFERLKVFYRQGMPYAGWQTYRSINLSFNDQVVCKR
jgi:cell division protein FtsQ